MKILNDIVTGYKTNDREIRIYDEEGDLFYLYDNPTGRTIAFNLSCGEFFTENDIEELPRAIKYVCPELPKPDKNIIPKEMTFHVGYVPQKARIDVNRGIVLIDNTINEKSKPFKAFVLLHEVGHNFYNGGVHEHYCDIFAAKQMLEKFGFNQSQVYLAHEFCLSDATKSINRKDYLHNYLQKVKRYA